MPFTTTQRQKIYFQNNLNANQNLNFSNPLEITGLNIEIKPSTGTIQKIEFKSDYLSQDFLLAVYSLEAVILSVFILFYKLLGK